MTFPLCPIWNCPSCLCQGAEVSAGLGSCECSEFSQTPLGQKRCSRARLAAQGLPKPCIPTGLLAGDKLRGWFLLESSVFVFYLNTRSHNTVGFLLQLAPFLKQCKVEGGKEWRVDDNPVNSSSSVWGFLHPFCTSQFQKCL